MLIADLARRMIAASKRDVPIVFTEPRPGDKLEEALVAARRGCTGRVTARLRSVAGPAQVRGGFLRWRQLWVLAIFRAAARLEELVPDYEPSAVLRDAVCAADEAAASLWLRRRAPTTAIVLAAEAAFRASCESICS